MNAPLSHFLDTLVLGEPVAHEGLVMYPLIASDDRPPDYLTLAKALASGLATVREVSEGGVVNTLFVVNHGSVPVLLLDGDILLGARQNRVVNVSILAPAHAETSIPVSCVEQGRWSYRAGRHFSASENSFKAASRARKAERVAGNRRFRGVADAGQSEVWDYVLESLNLTGTTNIAFTLDMECAYARFDTALQGVGKAIRPQASQCGAVFAIEDRLLGADAFDSAETFADALPRLIRGYAIEMFERRAPSKAVSLEDAKAAARFLAALKATSLTPCAAVGLGQEVHGVSMEAGVSALVLGDRVIHLFGYPREKTRSKTPE